MADTFITAVKTRRSNYTIKKSSVIPDDRIVEIVQDVAKHSPSALNSMPTRYVLLLGAEHDKLWAIVDKTTKNRMSEEKYQSLVNRIRIFQGAYGTLLFFQDPLVAEDISASHPGVASKAQQFSEHANAMSQYIAWTALTLEGLGCSLQHYNPWINTEVLQTWNLPSTWVLTAQLVFGEPTALPKEKNFKPVEDKIKVFGVGVGGKE